MVDNILIAISIYLFGSCITWLIVYFAERKFNSVDDFGYYLENHVVGIPGYCKNWDMDKVVRQMENAALWLWPLFWVLGIITYYKLKK